MCGIAGAVDRVGQRLFPVERLLSMTAAITHRGPDDECLHIEPGVALGARRLSIVDLAGGRQPIANEDGSIWVAFNGELFDYPELRALLLERGHKLATRCDTEAWVHLYEDFGEGMFQKTLGQYAVSLWDRNKRQLILGRDRIGICPLYYYYDAKEGWLLFASEIKALLASGMIPARPDPKGIDHLFNFFCAATTRSFFDGILSLPPGHFLRINPDGVTQHQYWDLDFPDQGAERLDAKPAALVDELESLLTHAVRRRLRGDVPVVSYISGGLDSTVVLGLATRERGVPVRSYTIGLDRAGPDERNQAAESAEVLNSPMSMVTLDPSKIALAFPELVVAAEGPVLDTSCACLMKLAAEVRSQGYKVALTGEGADEALAGYVWYKTQNLRRTVDRLLGRGLSGLVRKGFLRSIGGRKGLSRTPAREAIFGARTAQQDMYEFIGQTRAQLYSDQLWKDLEGHDPYTDLSITNDRMSKWDPLNQSLYVGYKVMLAGLLMISKGDRISMNSSVETRYPFLDEDVIQFCSTLHPSYKLRGRTEKWLLREVARKTLPAQIAGRPKTMFRAALSRTFLGADRPSWVDQLLSRESLNRAGLFDVAGVERQRRYQTSLPRITPNRFVYDVGLTCVVSTQLWHHLFCGGGLCDLPTWSPPAPRRAEEAQFA